jgi:hypothetical protein
MSLSLSSIAFRLWAFALAHGEFYKRGYDEQNQGLPGGGDYAED